MRKARGETLVEGKLTRENNKVIFVPASLLEPLCMYSVNFVCSGGVNLSYDFTTAPIPPRLFLLKEKNETAEPSVGNIFTLLKIHL